MKKQYIYIILATILFSTMEIALKMITGQYNPVQLTFLRFIIGAVILSPLAVKNLRKGNISLNIKDFKFFMLQGFICVVVSMTLYQLAIIYGKASIVAVLFSCNPIFVILFAHLIIKEKIYKHTIISLILSVTGIIFIMNPFHMINNVYGVVFALLSAVAFALYSVIGKTRSRRYGGVVQTCFSFFAGSFEILLLIFISRTKFISGLFTNPRFNIFANIPILHSITLHSIPSLIYIGIFVTGLGYSFYFLAIEKTSAATASLVFYIKPALAPILALMILGESIARTTIIGIILIIIGSAITFAANTGQLNGNTITAFRKKL